MGAGRPTMMTDELVNKLLDAFSWGCTDREACAYVGITTQTLYNYCKKHPEFIDQKETIKDTPTMKAKRIILSALDAQDLDTAHKVVSRGRKYNIDIGNGSEVEQADKVVQAAGSGDLDPAVAVQMIQAIKAKADIRKTSELEDRIEQLEKLAGG